MYNNAGEAIEKMLVEKRISTKLNYDVLRDIEIDLGHQSSLGHTPDPISNQTSSTSIGRTAPIAADLTITRAPMQPRLPSLTSRKRDFSSFSGLSPFASLSPHPLSVSQSSNPKRSKIAGPVLNDNVDEVGKAVLSLVGTESGSQDSCVPEEVEESGPVEYCDEDDDGEGLDDEEMEELIYEDDPLLAHSDTEDYNEDY
jgi:hypothetical protein